MPKKKQNPNRIPISIDDDCLEEIKINVTNQMVLRGWALIMAALASFCDTTADTMENVWHTVNQYQTKIHTYRDAASHLSDVEQRTDVHIPCEPLGTIKIRTQGDLLKFHRKLDRYAMGLAWAILSEPMFSQKIFPDERLGKILEKAMAFDEELKEGRISLEDIQEMLREEYGIILEERDHIARLSRIEA